MTLRFAPPLAFHRASLRFAALLACCPASFRFALPPSLNFLSCLFEVCPAISFLPCLFEVCPAISFLSCPCCVRVRACVRACVYVCGWVWGGGGEKREEEVGSVLNSGPENSGPESANYRQGSVADAHVNYHLEAVQWRFLSTVLCGDATLVMTTIQMDGCNGGFSQHVSRCPDKAMALHRRWTTGKASWQSWWPVLNTCNGVLVRRWRYTAGGRLGRLHGSPGGQFSTLLTLS
jgi:hypothetical protein